MSDTILYIVNVEGAIFDGDRFLMIVRGHEEDHAAGLLAFVGGKVEDTEPVEHVLEETLRREIIEEVGVEVGDITYGHSRHFTTKPNVYVVDIVFVCAYQSGEPRIIDHGEVAEILWLTADEILAHPAAPAWVKADIQRVEAIRRQMIGS